MKPIIEKILERYGLLDAFNTSREFHLRIENPPWMVLVIERHDDEISVAHYTEQNGDLIRDPELTFRWPDWVPTSITQDLLAHYAEVFPIIDGKQRVRPGLLADLKSFAAMWAGNLQAQGFTERGEATSLTHAALLKQQS